MPVGMDRFVPPDLTSAMPACLPPGKPDWVRIGNAMYHRSCFRMLPDLPDRKELADWRDDVRKTLPPKDPSSVCRLNEFGAIELGTRGALPLVPHEQIWAENFTRDYPARGIHPRTAAEAIHTSFREVLMAVDTCLEKINHEYAARMRMAMAVTPRPGKRRGAPGKIYLPYIGCGEQIALECEPEYCERAQGELWRGFDPAKNEDGPGALEDALRGLMSEGHCRPAHAPGTTLGSTDTANLRPGDVCDGSPRIDLFNATARFANTALGGPSTLFHEFLHAAGVPDSPGHNHGTKEDELPAGDSVYACQAVAFQAFFKGISDDELRDACIQCAGSVIEKAHCFLGRKHLATLGCRAP
jgi:hypothetical protein